MTEQTQKPSPPLSSPMPPVGIVGPGRLGSVLARALLGLGTTVTVHGGSESPAALAARLPGAHVAQDLPGLLSKAQRLFLTPGDGAIEAIAEGLTGLGSQHAVIHCSGALPLTVLGACQARGAAIGCFHPLQAFPDRGAGAERFAGITVGIEAPDGALSGQLLALATRLDAVPVSLAGVDRTRYHAAAVLASNCLVGLLQAASRVWTEAGLPTEAALGALLPLTAGALSAVSKGTTAPGNAGQENPSQASASQTSVSHHDASTQLAQALTGPLARGDVDTVAAQLQALSDSPDLRAVYASISRQLLTLHKPDDDGARARLEALLR